MELQGLEAAVPSARKESCGRSEYFLRALVCVYSVCCTLLVAGRGACANSCFPKPFMSLFFGGFVYFYILTYTLICLIERLMLQADRLMNIVVEK